ncbi:hypothetical protein EN809_022230 [Mesorhizobium sp. M2E.F.Ca.ET.166.01.1.1]|nr:hypothetical protein EN862_013885 [Mesorhizobium sp. M2E.F.Ca.ET.219.01.1.1]TGT70701.1 hypothetical protein EN809_022230 [Mesorhizobium sp. M2E.F.Ca.ET.166.01.1.1]TGV98935.1 hypothetical protein EN797_028420 [Mesorhizobium sp. M2E.F.Ca.ET.154.01.1.1]
MSCRTSPPLGGRSDRTTAFANFQRCRKKWRRWRRPISPLVGEMSGRTEGGAVERQRSSLLLWSPARAYSNLSGR